MFVAVAVHQYVRSPPHTYMGLLLFHHYLLFRYYLFDIVAPTPFYLQGFRLRTQHGRQNTNRNRGR